MNAVLGAVLPLAVGVAISPVPVIAVILMLFSPRARSTSAGFLVGWVLGIVVATGLFTALAGMLPTGGAPPTWASWTKIVLGSLLLLLGVRQWAGRSGRTDPPAWMAAIDGFTFAKSLALAFALAAVNPKNLLMAAGAGVEIGSVDLTLAQEVLAILVFTVIAASTVAVPVIGYQVAADRMRGPLEQMREWLESHNAAVMAVLFVVIGVVLIGKGLGGL